MLEELKKSVVGKTLSEVVDVDFGTCYPVVCQEDINDDDAEIIDVVCAEYGNHDEDGDRWNNNGKVAWFAEERPAHWPETLSVYDIDYGDTTIAVDKNDCPEEYCQKYIEACGWQDETSGEQMFSESSWKLASWNDDLGHYEFNGRENGGAWNIDDITFLPDHFDLDD